MGQLFWGVKQGNAILVHRQQLDKRYTAEVIKG